MKDAITLLLTALLALFLSCEKSVQEKGDTLAANWQLEKALEYYQKAFLQDSTDSKLLEKMGDLFVKLEYYEDALSVYDRALRPNNDPELKRKRKIAALLSSGFAAIHQDSLQKAEVIYEQILKIAPDHPIALKNLGLVKLALGDSASAKSSFEKVIELMKDFPQANLTQEAQNMISQIK